MSDEPDGRYPRTHAYDFLRHLAGYDHSGTKLSRVDAARVIQGIADATGVPEEELARKLANYQAANQEAISKEAADQLLGVILHGR